MWDSTRWDSPFTMRVGRFVDLTPDDVESLRGLIECETAIRKRRDLVVDGYPYTEGMVTVADKHVELVDVRALQLLAHFQPATLAPIPAARQPDQNLIA